MPFDTHTWLWHINMNLFKQAGLKADYDPNGLLGRDTEVRPGFQELRIRVEIDADLDTAQKQRLLEQIEQRCPLADNLAHGTRLVSRLA